MRDTYRIDRNTIPVEEYENSKPLYPIGETEITIDRSLRCLPPQSHYKEGYYSQSEPATKIIEPTLPAPSFGAISRRYDSGNGFAMTHTHYDLDMYFWYLIEMKKYKKTCVKPLTAVFYIETVTFINEFGYQDTKYVLIKGDANGHQSTILKFEDYVNQRFYPTMCWIKKCAGCTKKQVNDLIYDQIQKAPKYKVEIYPRQGFIKMSDTDYVFGAYSEKMGVYAEIMSDSVKMKKLVPLYREPQEIIQRWLSIYASHPTLKFLGLISIAEKMQFILEENGISFKQIIAVSPSTDIDEERLKAMLYSFDIKNYPVPLLALSEKGLLAYLNQIWDSPAVFLDTSFSDEAASIEEPLRTLIKANRGNYGEGCAGRNIIAVISGNAGYIAHRISPESVIPISMEGITLDYSIEYIRNVTSEMETFVIDNILRRISEIRYLSSSIIKEVMEDRHRFQTEEALNSAIYLLLAEKFSRHFLGVNIVSSEELREFTHNVNTQRNALVDSGTAILRDFAKIASDKFRSGSFKAVRKKNGMVVNDAGNTAIVSGNRLYLTGEMITELLSQMSTTHNMKALLNALVRYNALDAKDGFTHPLDAHTINGEAVRLYLYDISADILDADVVYMLQNPETAAFLLTKEESKIVGFMPLISDKSGKIAGKRFVYNDAENDSIAIYGQAGEGKSYTKHQIMASRFTQGYDILVFDTSDSDTYEALCANLSQSFVDKNVVFHKLDDSELHINIFDIDRSASLPSQKKEMVGIITAAVGDLSVPQANALRTVCSELLEKTDIDKPISPDDLLRGLNREGATFESLRNRLEPFIEDIKEYGLMSGCWKDFFNDGHKIHVVQMNEGFSENSNQIIDALLAGLFNYKRENPQRPLSVFIDEVQNQNFSTSSPIRKFLKEGRKHHLSVVAATQDFYARGSEIGSALGKAGMQIHHCPTQNSATLVAAELRWNKADMARFDSMNRGDIVVKGALYNKENERNMQTILSGHVVSFLSDGIIDEPDEDAEITDDDC